MTDCHGRQHNHQDNGKNIFQNQHTEHQPGKLFLAHAQIIKCLIDNSSGRHGYHTAQENAIHPFPSESRANCHAQQYHTEYNCTSSDYSSSPHLDYFLKAKLQPQSKQQENNADVRPSLYVCRIHHRRGISHVRTGQEACNDIPQD